MLFFSGSYYSTLKRTTFWKAVSHQCIHVTKATAILKVFENINVLMRGTLCFDDKQNSPSVMFVGYGRGHDTSGHMGLGGPCLLVEASWSAAVYPNLFYGSLLSDVSLNLISFFTRTWTQERAHRELRTSESFLLISKYKWQSY